MRLDFYLVDLGEVVKGTGDFDEKRAPAASPYVEALDAEGPVGVYELRGAAQRPKVGQISFKIGTERANIRGAHFGGERNASELEQVADTAGHLRPQLAAPAELSLEPVETRARDVARHVGPHDQGTQRGEGLVRQLLEQLEVVRLEHQLEIHTPKLLQVVD